MCLKNIIPTSYAVPSGFSPAFKSESLTSSLPKRELQSNLGVLLSKRSPKSGPSFSGSLHCQHSALSVHKLWNTPQSMTSKQIVSQTNQTQYAPPTWRPILTKQLRVIVLWSFLFFSRFLELRLFHTLSCLSVFQYLYLQYKFIHWIV